MNYIDKSMIYIDSSIIAFIFLWELILITGSLNIQKITFPFLK